ncbi:MAG: hypothetical protein H7Y30_02455 [Pyrinomonadaceae bacterium]|nr:hypothetical protein [Pyrinomonadaceae bacterium]
MKTGLTILLLAWFVMLASCTHEPAHQISMLGQYELVGHDTAGRVAFTGTISLISLEGNHLKGRCIITRKEYAPEGLFEKNGGCEGLIEGKKVSFDFAPSLDDGGLLLDGQFVDSRITGTWRLDGFVTSEPLGKFEVVKKDK